MKRTDAFIIFLLCLPLVASGDDVFQPKRDRLVREEIQRAGVDDPRVLEVMRKTPRHLFVPETVQRQAYLDVALPIGAGQTISSPYIVARMTEQLEPKPNDRILEIGTGSGYQAAVLSPLVKEVYSIEIVPELGERAKKTLEELGYDNVKVRVGDGYKGWKEHAPFDKVIVTCSPEDIPEPLVEQLAEGGHMVIPVGERFQQALCRFTKAAGQLKRERIEATYFVPMTGKAESERQVTSDESRPEIVNGSFEDRAFEGEPKGWYYIRNGKVVKDPKSPRGTQCLELRKSGGSPARAIQPVGVDGATVKTLDVSLWSKREGVIGGLLTIERSQLVVEFYDANRKLCGDGSIPLAAGTRDWKQHTASIPVPEETRLAMVQVGLFGANGTLWVDDVSVSAVQAQSNASASQR